VTLQPCRRKFGELSVALGNDFEVDTDTLRDAILRWRRSLRKAMRDVVSVLQISRNKIDQAYLTVWASRLRITDLLERARR